MNAKITDACSSLASSLCNAFGASLTQACGLPWQVANLREIEENALLSASQEGHRIVFGSPLDGRCSISFHAKDKSEHNSADAGSTDLWGETGAIAVALRSSVERVRGLLRLEYRDMAMAVERVQDDGVPNGKDTAQGLVLSAELHSGQTSLSMQMIFDAPLLASLSVPTLHPLLAGKMEGIVVQPNLDLVMDVALNVTLRFGRRQLPLREIIDLASGSVVELDRQVDEPIELVLDGRVIARGEAVIIDGNYGMRVTQIVQPLLNA